MKRKALVSSLLSFFVFCASAQAQVSAPAIDSIIDGVINKEVMSAPSDWPNEFVWRAYSNDVSVPHSSDRVQEVRVPGFADGLDFNSLPLQHAIVRVRGNGERKVAILADPTCPYSRQIERNINQIDNVTIYTLVAPILKSPRSEDWTKGIMCLETNQERAQAWEALMLNDKEPVVISCSEPSEQVLQAFEGINIPNRTGFYNEISPVFVFENNITGYGAVSTANAEKALSLKNPADW